jgi:holliday junction DNA helicase RuvA
MIALLTGRLKRKAPDHLIIDVAGVGYLVQVPLSTYNSLPELEEELTLQIHTHVREDALLLFGFLTEAEKNMFQLLMGVSGIGPKLALTILSSVPFSEFIRAVSSSDHARLYAIPGIGKKTAGHIVLELKDKISQFSEYVAHDKQALPKIDHLEDAVSALISLGYKKGQAEDAIRKAHSKRTGLRVEELIREALIYLANR